MTIRDSYSTLTPDRAEVIRDVLGIRKRAELGPDELERRRALGKRLALAAGRANAGAPLPTQPAVEAAAKFSQSHRP